MSLKKPSLKHLELALGYKFKDLKLLEKSLTHKSYAYEHGKDRFLHNERLEFLGDAVLELAITDLLMKRFPTNTEGELSRLRSAIVNESQLAHVAMNLNLSDMLFLGKGEEQTDGRLKSSILANTYEAILAALYLDGGYEATYRIIEAHFKKLLDMAAAEDINQDYKTRLQEETQKWHKRIPTYVVIKEVGPDHNKIFKVMATVNEKVLAFGSGKSKKEAEQDAARNALHVLREEEQF